MRQLCSAVDQASGGLQVPWGWSLSRLRREFGWPESVLCSFDRYRRSHGLQPCIEVPDHVLLPCDPGWPEVFAKLERPPLSIQWRGDRGLLSLLSSQQAVAVVGTRRPSSHGLRMAECLVRALAQAGWPVVSGLAEGIDAAVHRACLEAGGQTIAVLGTPLHRVYPSEHDQLQRAVAEDGLLLTEFRDSERVTRSGFREETDCLPLSQGLLLWSNVRRTVERFVPLPWRVRWTSRSGLFQVTLCVTQLREAMLCFDQSLSR